MPDKWSEAERRMRKRELEILYNKKRLSISEIGKILNIAPQTVFQRLRSLNIKTDPTSKKHYLNRRTDISIPLKMDSNVVEFLGIMLGDGNLTHFQIKVTLGDKEGEYVQYVANLIGKVFKTRAKISTRKTGYKDVYLGSTEATRWLFGLGLVSNKTKYQVDVPPAIWEREALIKYFIRGFFDTDGSIYSLKKERQISLTNSSAPLLVSLRKMLFILGYNPSRISHGKIYLTRSEDVDRFFLDISPKNSKHIRRYKKLGSVGVRAVK